MIKFIIKNIVSAKNNLSDSILLMAFTGTAASLLSVPILDIYGQTLYKGLCIGPRSNGGKKAHETVNSTLKHVDIIVIIISTLFKLLHLNEF